MIDVEPPDGSVIVWECGTDVYAAWRSDESSQQAGWSTGDGGRTWCVFGESVPRSWIALNNRFGGCPADRGVRLLWHPADDPIRAKWPTQVFAETGETDFSCPFEPLHDWEDPSD